MFLLYRSLCTVYRRLLLILRFKTPHSLGEGTSQATLSARQINL